VGPFDRFNDRAKRVLALAQDEAIRFNHNYIGPEHLLLGLVREGEGVAARSLDSLGVELSKARTAVEFLIGRGDATASPSEITLVPRTKKIIELAIDEARKLGHSHVGTEHLLLGLIRESGHTASGVLESFGVAAETVRERVIETLGSGAHSQEMRTAPPAAVTFTATRFGASPVADRLSGGAAAALARAYWEAGRLNHEEVGAAHLLIALMEPASVWIRRVLEQLNVRAEDIVAAAEARVPRREGPSPAGLKQSNDLEAALARAAAVAASRGSPLVRPEHLLLALVAGEDVPGAVLRAADLRADRVGEVIDRMSR
jgi:ATP-dependent Clp protease ATP-binding subunit ClpA